MCLGRCPCTTAGMRVSEQSAVYVYVYVYVYWIGLCWPGLLSWI
jgi:hypothetical protein